MRVLKVLHGSPPDTMGGAGLVAGALAEALHRLGCDVRIAHPGRDDQGPWRAIATVGSGAKRTRGFDGSWRGDPDAFMRILHAFRPDVVHVHHLSGWPLDLPVLARQAGTRVIVTLHDYATICPRGQLVNEAGEVCPGPSVRRCSRCLHPFLGVRARLTGRPSLADRRSVSHRLAQAVRSLNAAHVRLSPSRDLARRMMRLGTGPVHVHPIPLPAPIPRARPTSAGPLRFLFCGSLLPTKGPQHLLAAFRCLDPGSATLTIAGPAPEFPADPTFGARLMTAADPTPGVSVAGPVPHPDIPALLSQHDVLVVPSIWPENSPLIVREATSAGLRTILPIVGGARELDPEARLIDTSSASVVASLLDAMMGEIGAGKNRREPLRWASPDTCARSLLSGWYASRETATPHIH